MGIADVGKHPVAWKENCAGKGDSRKVWIGTLATLVFIIKIMLKSSLTLTHTIDNC